MLTRLYHHPIFAEHLTGAGHPERPERMAAVLGALEAERFQDLDRALAPEGDIEAVYRCHPPDYVRALAKAVPTEGLYRIDEDTVVSPKSFAAALHAVGGACAAVDDVMTGAARNAFVAARPPGHHAERQTVMGFCLFNQVAIAARHAQAKHGLERIAILDWDVHHGNGTQDIFFEDPSVLYVSLHQMPLYPGTGARSETGVGNIVNLPLSPGSGGEDFREAMETTGIPAIQAFRPDFLLISAGFDAHRRDPLGSLALGEADFDWATGKLLDVAGACCDGRLVSILEGGYDLEALGASAATHVHRLMVG